MSDASDLYFQQIPVGEMANLAYLIGSRSTREVLLVDPAWNVDGLLEQAEADGMKVVGALITHYHQDHVGGSIFGMNIEGVAKLLERAPVPIYVNEHEAEGTRRITGASASDLAPRIRVNEILPGAIETPALQRNLERMPAEIRAEMLRRTPMRRNGMPEDIADAAVYLASPASRWVTGKLLEVDGGAFGDLIPRDTPDL